MHILIKDESRTIAVMCTWEAVMGGLRGQGQGQGTDWNTVSSNQAINQTKAPCELVSELGLPHLPAMPEALGKFLIYISDSVTFGNWVIDGKYRSFLLIVR